MRKIKIDFTDFWRDFDKMDNYFYHLLSEKYQLEISEEPDFLIYCTKGTAHRRYSCIKIFYTGENIRPDFWECDFAFSFDYSESGKNYRLPLYALYDDAEKILLKPPVADILRSKTNFCNFIYSNSKAKERIRFFNLLNDYKKVDSGGSVLNNIGYNVQNKREFIRSYKFTISFENESYPGYLTEKIFEPMLEWSLPIYWGDPLVANEFNSKSFINVREYNSFEDVVRRIIQIDNSNELYSDYLKEPYFFNNEMPKNIRKENILRQFDLIFNQIGVLSPTAGTFKSYIAFARKDALGRLRNYYKLITK